MNELPGQFAQTALLNPSYQEASEGNASNSEIHGSEDDMTKIEDNVFQTRAGDKTVQIDVNNAVNFQPSYNIAPTNSALIISMVNTSDVDYKYVVETLKFGMVPFWSKPSRELKQDEDAWTVYKKEIGATESKYFNCRKETMEKSSPVWNSSKKTRCIVPIQGYYEWQKLNQRKNEKVPYFVHNTKLPILYLAGMYSHNTNFKAIANSPNGEYLSSFTIVTGHADKADSNDISWLHPRKPIMLEPGSQEWFDWLNPDHTWLDKLFDTSLNTATNKGFANIDAYTVSKDVGPTKNNGEYLMKRESKPQSAITLFFLPKKREGKQDEGDNKRLKLEKNDTKEPIKEEAKEGVKDEAKEEVKQEVKKEDKSSI